MSRKLASMALIPAAAASGVASADFLAYVTAMAASMISQGSSVCERGDMRAAGHDAIVASSFTAHSTRYATGAERRDRRWAISHHAQLGKREMTKCVVAPHMHQRTQI
eukprot:195948-Pleurochrysis_carterae.AAC.3